VSKYKGSHFLSSFSLKELLLTCLPVLAGLMMIPPFMSGLVSLCLCVLALFLLFVVTLSESEDLFWFGSALAFVSLLLLAPPVRIILFGVFFLLPSVVLGWASNFGKCFRKKKGRTLRGTWSFEMRVGYAMIFYLCCLSLFLLYVLPPFEFISSIVEKKIPGGEMQVFKHLWHLAPALLCLSWAFVLGAGFVLAARLWRHLRGTFLVRFRLENWVVPQLVYTCFCSIMILTLALKEPSVVVWTNFLCLFSLIFVVEGASLVLTLLTFWGVGTHSKFVYFFSFILGFPLIVFFILGFLEPVLNIRGRLKQAKK